MNVVFGLKTVNAGKFYVNVYYDSKRNVWIFVMLLQGITMATMTAYHSLLPKSLRQLLSSKNIFRQGICWDYVTGTIYVS